MAHVTDSAPAVRMVVRAMPASAAVWVAVLLFAGFPAAAMALPPGLFGGVGFGDGGGQARLAVEGGGIGGRLAQAARGLAPTKPGWVVTSIGRESLGAGECERTTCSTWIGSIAVASGVRVEHLNLPPPGGVEAR